MRLPFTEQQFLDIFGAYNSALWPFVAALWLATCWVVVQLLGRRVQTRTVSLVAAAHWAWSGIVYHALFFARINPAAWLFALMFVAQAFAFVWFGLLRRTLAFEWRAGLRHAIAGVLLVYSLAYPGLIVLSGHVFPRGPAAAVPCPTTLFTAGLLLAAAPPVPRSLFVIPIAWSLIGGSAAIFLRVTPDLMLLVAAAVLAVYASRRESRSADTQKIAGGMTGC